MTTASFQRSAEFVWEGELVHGHGVAHALSRAFDVPVRFPSLRGEPASTTTPEELLAAAHAACFAIGLRSVIARNRGTVTKIRVTATLMAEKGPEGIRVRRSHLEGIVEGLSGINDSTFAALGVVVERECTISQAIRGSVEITHNIRSGS